MAHTTGHDPAPQPVAVVRSGRRGERQASSADALARDLAPRIRGEVRFDSGSRGLYATDASNYRQVPIGVVVPRDADDVVTALESCRTHGVPVLGRGGGTSLAGQCCNIAVVFDFSKYMHHVIEIDPTARVARVQPGTPLDTLRAAAAPHGLTFGPDPATHQYCTIGGMIGNNSCGVHSVMADFYGPGPTTADSVEALEVITADGLRLRVGGGEDEAAAVVRRGGAPGRLYQRIAAFRDKYAELIRREFPDIPRRVSGYNLPALLPENGFHIGRALVGSESTLAMTLEATVTLLPRLPCRVLVVLGYPSVYDAADHVGDVLTHRPVGLEGIDDMLVRDLRQLGLPRSHLQLLPEGGGWLLAEFGADSNDEARDQAEALVAAVRAGRNAPDVRVVTDAAEQEHIWELRESGLAATARVTDRNPTWPGWEDSAVPPGQLGRYLRALRSLFDKFEYSPDLYGHFGQGCVHCRVDFDLASPHGVATFRSFLEEAAALVSSFGGSLSGEHGDGQARGELLNRMFSGDMLHALEEFKAIWDPDWRMNPGKIVEPNRLDANLRLGPGHQPASPSTWFRFPEENGQFRRATERCVGVGKCRKLDGGTMCPSYMVTREEAHSTRGRARLLFEMLEGDPIEHGWQNESVKEALDLCLACKGCKGECPVSVDMATYKAEFLAHYYERHRRPRSAYAFGFIHRWAGLAAIAPRLVNAALGVPGLEPLAKLAAGMAGQRRIPRFAPQTFRARFHRRPRVNSSGRPRVLLWSDTFNDHFHPDVSLAAVELLESIGCAVDIPRQRLCCGRPLYDYGFLGSARQHLVRILDSIGPEIDAGVPVVVLEPSCAAVFQDELTNLFPEDERAHRLAEQVCSLGAFLASRLDRLPTGAVRRRALLHGHCHQRALRDLDGERAVLDAVGIDYEVLDSGCCGMAGSFGFHPEHYDVSLAVGERSLLPRVRGAPEGTLIIADGFSCREQIVQTTPRSAEHLAQVLISQLQK